jgi:hypothetical protein
VDTYLGGTPKVGILGEAMETSASFEARACRDETAIRRSIMHALTPLLILCACIVTAQVQAPSPAPSHDKPEVKVDHVSFATEYGKSTAFEVVCVIRVALSVVVGVLGIWAQRTASSWKCLAGCKYRLG